MTIATATDFRQNMAKYIRDAKNNKLPITITTQKEGSIVIISKEEWDAMQETHYLTVNPKNKSRLDKAIKGIGAKKYTQKSLLKP